MPRKLTFLFTLLVFATGYLTAQHADQVTLKNGSVIRGTVAEIVPMESVTIDDQAGNTWVFKMGEVEKIEKIEDKNVKAKPAVTSGIVNMTTIGFLPGSQSSQFRAPLSVQTSTGYKTSFDLYTGLLVGLEFLNINHIPLMADIQYQLGDGEVRPVFIARGGYAVPSKTSSDHYGTTYSYSGGITGGIGMGLKISSRERFAWDVSLLYRYMEVNYVEEYEWQDFPNTYKDVYNRLEIRIGFYLGY